MIAGLQKREDNIRGSLEQAEKTRRRGAWNCRRSSTSDEQGRTAQIAATSWTTPAAKRRAWPTSSRRCQGRGPGARRERLHHEIATETEAGEERTATARHVLAAAMSTKAVRRSMTEDDHRRLLDESLAELTGDSAARAFAGRSHQGGRAHEHRHRRKLLRALLRRAQPAGSSRLRRGADARRREAGQGRRRARTSSDALVHDLSPAPAGCWRSSWPAERCDATAKRADDRCRLPGQIRAAAGQLPAVLNDHERSTCSGRSGPPSAS